MPEENHAQNCFVGGDWFEDDRSSTDHAAANDGLLSSDNRPHPGLLALKKEQQNVQIELVDLTKRLFRIRNRFYFQPLEDHCRSVWQLLEDGNPIASGDVVLEGADSHTLRVTPQEDREFVVPADGKSLRPEHEYVLDFRFVLLRATPWARASHELAWEQVILQEAAPQTNRQSSEDAPLELSEGNATYHVQGRDFSAAFSRESGALTSYVWRGTQLLAEPTRPDFWRSPVDNDCGAKLPQKLGIWRGAGRNWEVHEASAAIKDDDGLRNVHVEFHGKLPRVGDANYNISYDVDPTGEIAVSVEYSPIDSDAAPMLPRFGMLWTLDGSLDQVAWYGRGPWPTYSDRKQAPLGIYSNSVRNEFIRYFRPQENSNKVDVRWVAVSNSSGIGLLARGNTTLSVGVSEFDNRQMERALYDFQLERRARTYLNLDLLQMGVGGIDSWGATPLRRYLPRNQDYSYRYTIRGIDQPPAPLISQ